MKKILYVEDNADTASAVKALLSREGFHVDLAADGNEGIRMARKEYDVILLDIMLPDMSGWDIFERVRQTTHAKIAFLSALPVSPERFAELKKSGVSDYITKPFDSGDLIARVKKMIS